MLSLQKQVAGQHYKNYTIEPVEFITKNKISFLEGNVIKYICRWRNKGGPQDLDKAIHYINIIKDFHEQEVNAYKNKGDTDEPPF